MMILTLKRTSEWLLHTCCVSTLSDTSYLFIFLIYFWFWYFFPFKVFILYVLNLKNLKISNIYQSFIIQANISTWHQFLSNPRLRLHSKNHCVFFFLILAWKKNVINIAVLAISFKFASKNLISTSSKVSVFIFHPSMLRKRSIECNILASAYARFYW